jgi:hypothetical protein
MNPEQYEMLKRLLPKLCQRPGHDRDMALDEINGVLLAAGLSWDFITGLLPLPAMQAGDVLDVIATIKRWPRLLSANAHAFLLGLHREALERDVVRMTPRQSDWLRMLHAKAAELSERAERNEQRAAKPAKPDDDLDERTSTLH